VLDRLVTHGAMTPGEMAPRDTWLARAMARVLSAAGRAELLHAAELMERLAEFERGVVTIER